MTSIVKDRVQQVRNIRHQMRRRSLRLPRTAASPSAPKEPTIYFAAPDYNEPAAGVAVMYRHVDLLNEAGIAAAVVHQVRGFRANWFKNETRVECVDDVVLHTGDLAVVGELDVDIVLRRARIEAIPHVIFNQSGYLTWRRGLSPITKHYRSLNETGLQAIVTVSQHAFDLLSFAFPEARIRRVHLSLDATSLYPPKRQPSKVVSYMPRRGAEDLAILREILAGRAALREWSFLPLEGLKHGEVAERLRSSRIFLALSGREGFGMPAAEAMACGNYVIGYDGLGGREFWHPEFSASVETGNLLQVARSVEEAVLEDESEPGWLRARGIAASEYVTRSYSRQNESADVVRVYREILEHLAEHPNSH